MITERGHGKVSAFVLGNQEGGIEQGTEREEPYFVFVEEFNYIRPLKHHRDNRLLSGSIMR